MKIRDHAKLFVLNSLSIESGVRNVQAELDIDLGPTHENREDVEDKYYPQFSERLRREAERMAKNYTIFYSLENSIRELISERLAEKYGEDWWDKPGVVPDNVAKNALANQKKELSTGVTPRSDHLIDFTNFGELSEIIKANWADFDDMFKDKRAVERIIANLNTLRASIAHCKALAEDEELRLHLSLRDWFRQQS